MIAPKPVSEQHSVPVVVHVALAECVERHHEEHPFHEVQHVVVAGKRS